MKATNLPSTFIQGYGFQACPGSMARHERDARASGGGVGIISLNIAKLTADFFIQI